MPRIGNLRFQKTFVFTPSTELVTSNATSPHQLTVGQVGIFNIATNVGTGGTPTKATAPIIQIHQNLGDSKHGTTRTPPIHIDQVTGWHAAKAVAPQTHIIYIGYDGVDTNKTLAHKAGDNVVIPITLYDREIKRWYGCVGYTVRIVPNSKVYAGLNDGDAVNQSTFADDIVAQINGTDAPAGQYPTNRELKNFVVASKVSSGTSYGIKIETIIPSIELLNKYDPKQFYKPNNRYFTVGSPVDSVAFPITVTQKQRPGTGWPLEVQDLEKESQGYDRVPESFEYAENMRTPFIIRAADGVKYDMYFLEYNVAHNRSGLPERISDQYVAIFCVPTGGGGSFETVINSWLTPLGFASVSIASSTGKGTPPTFA